EESEQSLPQLAVGDAVTCTQADALAKQTKPPARYSEGTLLRAMETAGKLVDDDEAAEAMKDAGIGTPATRAATIERLVDAEYIEREGRSLRATEKGVGLIKMLGDHVVTRSTASPARWWPGSATRSAATCASSASRSPPARRPAARARSSSTPRAT